MVKDNFTTAINALENIIKLIKSDKYIKGVTIRLICSKGGINDIQIQTTSSGLCACDKSSCAVDDPDLLRIHYRKILQKIKSIKKNGAVLVWIECRNSMIFNSRSGEEYSNLFSRDLGSDIESVGGF